MDRKSGVDPGLRAALDQDAVVTSGALELLDGLARPRARLAKNVDGRARLVLREKGFDPEFVERDQSCARHMRAGIFRRRADIQQLMRIAGAEKRRERGGRNAFGLDFDHVYM